MVVAGTCVLTCANVMRPTAIHGPEWESCGQYADSRSIVHVSYSSESPTVVVELWDCDGALTHEADSAIESFIGQFDVLSVQG